MGFMLWTAPRRVESLSLVQYSSTRRVGRHRLSSVMPIMAVGLLQITHYVTAGGPWHTERIVDPTWAAVEEAINKLDRCLLPFIWLYDDPAAQPDGVPEFEILGGNQAYVVAIRCGGKEHWLQNPEGGDEEIDVWVSDQGASFPASLVSPSLAEVLRVAQYYFTYGLADPQSVWA